MVPGSHKISLIKRAIEQKVLKKGEDDRALRARGNEALWMFDFRRMFLDAEEVNRISEVFWDTVGDEYPFQVGGLETASIPLITAIGLKGRERGTPINTFYLRKTRKKVGLQKIIEGSLNNEKVILVDDLINTGGSFRYQMKVIAAMGKNASAIFVLVQFQDTETYAFIREGDVALVSLFTLRDFGLALDQVTDKPVSTDTFEEKWRVQHQGAEPAFDVSKSTPILNNEHILYGTDAGVFYAVNQENGEVVWSKEVRSPKKYAGIFSAPIVYKNIVCFSASKGSVYALDIKTGSMLWEYKDMDTIGSSISELARDKYTLFAGGKCGLFSKRGVLVSLDMRTGKRNWIFNTKDSLCTSPLFLKKYNTVLVSAKNGTTYAVSAETGKLVWESQMAGTVQSPLAFDEQSNLVFYGSLEGIVYGIDAKTGTVIKKYETFDTVYAVPLALDGRLYVASSDKYLYCFDIESEKTVWTFEAGGRMCASPVCIEHSIFCGANDGKMYEIDRETGKLIGGFQTTERIVNPIVYNKKTKRFFLTTYMNEIYCLERK